MKLNADLNTIYNLPNNLDSHYVHVEVIDDDIPTEAFVNKFGFIKFRDYIIFMIELSSQSIINQSWLSNSERISQLNTRLLHLEKLKDKTKFPEYWI